MAIAPIGPITPLTQALSPAAPADASAGLDFGKAFATALDGLQAATDKADGLAVQAATGDLQDVHTYTIAANEAALTTELTVAIRDKAVEAFNDIMRMQI